MRFISVLARELNPAHDLDRVGYSDSFRNVFLYLINAPKHVIRGSAYGYVTGVCIGSLAGAILAKTSGGDIQTTTAIFAGYTAAGAELGMISGGLVDTLQYFWRSFGRRVSSLGHSTYQRQ
ncbi:MAG: hypothetical protein HYT70_04055 [Candidatus Aenigmarchaeota archaeon]|nr:hypothetical protein [Candidatus Aenigmarchaeota archaeon]